MTNTQPNPIQTTDAGIPVESDEYSLTVGAGGPILLQDSYLIEQMASFNRERIAERQPHAKGRAHDAHCDIDRIHYAYVPTIALGRWSCLPGRHEARLPASRNFSTAQVRPTASPEREISPKPCDVGSPSQEQRLAQPEREAVTPGSSSDPLRPGERKEPAWEPTTTRSSAGWTRGTPRRPGWSPGRAGDRLPRADPLTRSCSSRCRNPVSPWNR